jgi:hypothetical protein
MNRRNLEQSPPSRQSLIDRPGREITDIQSTWSIKKSRQKYAEKGVWRVYGSAEIPYKQRLAAGFAAHSIDSGRGFLYIAAPNRN